MNQKLLDRINSLENLEINLSPPGNDPPTDAQRTLVDKLTAADQALERPEWTRRAVSAWLSDVLGDREKPGVSLEWGDSPTGYSVLDQAYSGVENVA